MTTPQLPASLFFNNAQQRVALARERFFERGDRPSGLVAESVLQSWARCVGARRQPNERIEFDLVTRSRVTTTLTRNRDLLGAVGAELAQLDTALAGTGCTPILTSHDGVVVHVGLATRGAEGLLRVAARVGVDLSEAVIGTAAPGVAARTNEVVMVNGGEHFFDRVGVMYCAAAPVRDAQGHVAAVLDLTQENEMFRFDAGAMVRLYATAMENCLLEMQASPHLLLRFQTQAALIDTPLKALACIDAKGSVRWVNGMATSLLGCSRPLGSDVDCEGLLGVSFERLLALAHRDRVHPHRAPSGLLLYLSARLPHASALAPGIALDVCASVPEPPVSTPPAATTAETTLRNASLSLIEQTLESCDGNVSRAARQLGVSRGLLYRRLQRGKPRS
jgi:sigma-54 dependent transcriptional regulator, acetoin dehydrogenase operon transcriptional activator AcoR